MLKKTACSPQSAFYLHSDRWRSPPPPFIPELSVAGGEYTSAINLFMPTLWQLEMKQNQCDFWWASILALLSLLFSHSLKRGIARSTVLHGPVQYRLQFLLGGLFQDMPLTALVIFSISTRMVLVGGLGPGPKLRTLLWTSVLWHLFVCTFCYFMTQKVLVRLQRKPVLVWTNSCFANRFICQLFLQFFFFKACYSTSCQVLYFK